MEVILFVIAFATFLGLFFSIIELVWGYRQIKNLKDEPLLKDTQSPSLTIILSALNEEDVISDALISLIHLDYPSLEIIAINDRSTDKTPEILERMKQDEPRLRVYHILELPDGWLGKNHALEFAAQQAQGAWLLFTDADVKMKPDTIRRAMSYVLNHQLDHLTIFEHHIRKTFWLKILLLGHYLTYSMVMKPWRIRYAWSKKSLGHGAFNLVNKKAYQACGGHQAIAMECMDDLKLGELIKRNGFRQDTVDGRDFIEKEWYKSLPDMIDGLKKNSFSYFKYRPLGTVLVMMAAFVFYVWPFFGLFLSGALRDLNLMNIGLTLFIASYVAAYFRLDPKYAIFYPISICIVLYTVLNSLIFTYKNQGVIWRGTFYSIKNLKKT